MAQFEGGQMLPINHEGFNILHQEWVCIGIFPTSKILKPLLFLRFVLLLKMFILVHRMAMHYKTCILHYINLLPECITKKDK